MAISRDLRLPSLKEVMFCWSCWSIYPIFLPYFEFLKFYFISWITSQVELERIFKEFFEVTGAKIRFFDIFLNALFFGISSQITYLLISILLERDESPLRVLIFPRSALSNISQGSIPYSSLYRGMNMIFIPLKRDEYGIHPSKKTENAERVNISTLEKDFIPL